MQRRYPAGQKRLDHKSCQSTNHRTLMKEREKIERKKYRKTRKFALKLVKNGKKVYPFRLGSQKNAVRQKEL